MKKVNQSGRVLSSSAATFSALHDLPQCTFSRAKAKTEVATTIDAFRQQVNHFAARIAQHWIPSQVIASETCKHYYECSVDRQPSGLGSIILFTLWMSGGPLQSVLYIMPDEQFGQPEFKLKMTDYWLDYFAKEDDIVWNWFTDHEDITCELKLRHVVDLAGHRRWWQSFFAPQSLRHSLLQDIFALALIIQRTPESFFWDLAAEIWGRNHALSVAFVDHVVHKHREFKRNFIGVLGDDVTEQYDLMKQWLKYKKCHPEGGLSVDEGVNLVGNRLSKLG